MSALDDLHVLDLTTSMAGAWCTRLLADLGADVVLVEPPAGHPLRRLRPLTADGSSIPARYVQANKRSLAADLETDDGRRRVASVAATSDVVVDSHSPGELARFGLDFETLERQRPGIVVASITPHGQSGERQRHAGNELTAFALSGWASINGRAEGPPLKGGGHLGSYLAGTAACGAVLAALWARDERGIGQTIDLAETELLLEMFAPGVLSALHSGLQSRGGRRDLHGGAMLKTKDGHFAFSLTRGARWAEALVALGLEELAADERFGSEEGRTSADFIAAVEARVAELDKMEMFEKLAPVRTAGGPVLNLAELASNEHLRARCFFVRPDDNEDGPEFPGAPFRMPHSPWRLRRSAPAPGEHSEEVLAELEGREMRLPNASSPAAEPVSDDAPPLAGLRVIAFTHAWVGPFCAELLALNGADVVQVESRQRPDEFRAGIFEGEVPPKLRDVTSAVNSWNCQPQYNAVNLNKRAITLDLKTPEGADLLQRLVAEADVVVENFSVRVKERLGIGYEALRCTNPDLVMVSISGYGQTGPWRERLAGGGQIEASCGMSSLMGDAEEPMNYSRTIADPTAGYYAFVAVLAALRHRRRTGEGQHVDLAMQEANHCCVGDAMLEYFETGRVRERMGNRHLSFAPHGVYPARGEERWVALAAENEAQWRELCRIAKRPRWLEDPRFLGNGGRKHNEDALDEAIAEWTVTRGRDRLAQELAGAGLPAAPVLDAVEVSADTVFRQRGVVADVAHPETGSWPQVGIPYHYSRTPIWVDRPAPLHGEHSAEVFAEWVGMEEAAYRELEAKGVTGMGPPEGWRRVVFEGRWRRIDYSRPIANVSIHDDAKAREYGFSRGFGFGDAAIDAVMPAILSRYGAPWLEGGWFDLKLVGPLYGDEEVREVAYSDDRENEALTLELVTRDGRLICVGHAGLGVNPPWDGLEVSPQSSEIFPQARLGHKTEETDFAIRREDYLALLDASGNDSAWFREASPWGDPVAPPTALFFKMHDPWHDLGEGIIDSPPINAGLQMVIDRPIALGETCRARGELVDKGISGRCWFRTVEFVVRDAEGRRCAALRQKAKWFAPE